MRAPGLKFVRRLLIGVIVLVLISILFNYLHFRRGRSQSSVKSPPILSSDTVRSVENVEYTDNQDGRVRFKIHALRVLETKGGKSLLRGIEAYDFNPDGSVHNQIRSEKAEYDRDRKIADFAGDVRVFLGTGIELRTDSLHYDLNLNLGSTPDALRLFSREAAGMARGARFDQKAESLELESAVVLGMERKKANQDGKPETEKIKVQSDKALFSQKSNRVSFQGKVNIESGADVLSGNLVEIALTSDRRHITSLTSAGDAAYRSSEPGGTRILNGDRIDFGINPSGKTVDKITITGNALFSSIAASSQEVLRGAEIYLELDPAKGLPRLVQSRNGFQFEMTQGTERTFLSGDRLNAQFTPATKSLQDIQVIKEARMLTGGSSAANELRADEIRVGFREFQGSTVMEKLRADGSAQWTMRSPRKGTVADREAARTISANSIEMFSYTNGTGMESGNAAGKVSIVESDRDKTVRRMLSDSAQFHFLPGDNQIKDLKAEGHVEVLYENSMDPAGNSRSASDHLTADFELAGGKSALSSISQWGHFTYNDNSKSATAGRCDYDPLKSILILRQSPRIVSDDMGNTTGEVVEYDQKQKVLSVRNSVRSLFKPHEGEGAFLGSSGTNSPVLVTADQLQYSTEAGRALYSGRVQLLSENGQLQAGTLEILNRGERLSAEGNIRHTVPMNQMSSKGGEGKPASSGSKSSSRISGDLPMIIESAALQYLKEKNLITYSGSVALHSNDVDLTSDSLDAVLDKTGNRIDHAIARGKVLLRQGERECKGEEAQYYLDPGRSIVLGNPAEVYDPGKGRSYARRLTWSRADDRILLENR
jgi:LPS export ABC transporter protein LptC